VPLAVCILLPSLKRLSPGIASRGPCNMDGNSSVPKRKGTDAYRRDHMHISLIFMVQREREREDMTKGRERERDIEKKTFRSYSIYACTVHKQIYIYISI
jgi:hypothetical protein